MQPPLLYYCTASFLDTALAVSSSIIIIGKNLPAEKISAKIAAIFPFLILFSSGQLVVFPALQRNTGCRIDIYRLYEKSSIPLPVLLLLALNLSLGGRNIPNNGAGSVLITDIGPDNSDALLCLSSVSGSPSTNWYYKYGESHQRRVQSDDRELGWRRNRGRNPSVVS